MSTGDIRFERFDSEELATEVARLVRKAVEAASVQITMCQELNCRLLESRDLARARLTELTELRPMSEAPDNEYILAKWDGSWVEVIREDGRWAECHGGRTRGGLPSCWLPLPEESAE